MNKLELLVHSKNEGKFQKADGTPVKIDMLSQAFIVEKAEGMIPSCNSIIFSPVDFIKGRTVDTIRYHMPLAFNGIILGMSFRGEQSFNFVKFTEV